MSKLVTIVAIGFIALLGAGGADAITWDFACGAAVCKVDLGVSTKTYTVGANSLFVSGFDNAPSTTGLLTEKNDTGELTGEESGVGLTSDANSEIPPTPHFLSVDLGAGLQGLTDWMIDLGSIQTGENYTIYTSPNPTDFSGGSSVACETAGTNSALHALCSGVLQRYIFITGGGTGGANIELTEIQATPVPEPATMFLGGLGLVAFGYAARRRLFGR